MIDVFFLLVIGVFVVLGMFRGVVSQVSSIVGIVGVFLFSSSLGQMLAQILGQSLGTSQTIARPLSLFLASIAIYTVIRLLGVLIEKSFVNQMTELKAMNRLGGGLLGSLKAICLVFILLFFVNLVPERNIRSWAPKLLESRFYQVASTYNPLGKDDVITRIKSQMTWLKKKMQPGPSIQKSIGQVVSKGAPENLPKEPSSAAAKKQIEVSDKRAEIEALMNDDELVKLLLDHAKVN